MKNLMSGDETSVSVAPRVHDDIIFIENDVIVCSLVQLQRGSAQYCVTSLTSQPPLRPAASTSLQSQYHYRES